jgi:hypothetical protein
MAAKGDFPKLIPGAFQKALYTRPNACKILVLLSAQCARRSGWDALAQHYLGWRQSDPG